MHVDDALGHVSFKPARGGLRPPNRPPAFSVVGTHLLDRERWPTRGRPGTTCLCGERGSVSPGWRAGGRVVSKAVMRVLLPSWADAASNGSVRMWARSGRASIWNSIPSRPRSTSRSLERHPGHDAGSGCWPALASTATARRKSNAGRGAAAAAAGVPEPRQVSNSCMSRRTSGAEMPRDASIHTHTRLRLILDRPNPTPTAASMAQRPLIQPPTDPVAPFDFAAAARLREERARQMLAAEEVRST